MRIYLAILALTWGGAAAAQEVVVPKFAQFPAPVYAGPIGRLDLSSPGAYSYRSRLKAASREPINFAGHFQVTMWGCGTDCITGAIIDAFDGQVTFLPSVETHDLRDTIDDNFRAFEFRSGSRLLILSGKISDDGLVGAHFFT
jgi:hypothetical protein